jgi:multidrug resistance efflux pump
MSSLYIRLGVLAGFGVLVAGAIASAQDRKTDRSDGPGDVPVFNSVESRTTVISSRPDGARVEKGDVVCALDAGGLKDRLAIQETVMQGAISEANGARIARELAAMAVTEYKEGTLAQQISASEGEIKTAESELVRAEDCTDWTRRMFEKGYVSLAQKVSEELALKKARFVLEQAQSKRYLLVNYAKGRTIKALLGEVESARARELSKQAELERQRLTHKHMLEEITHCKVTAPVGGRIHYAMPIGPGAVLHDGQLLFRIVPETAAPSAPK